MAKKPVAAREVMPDDKVEAALRAARPVVPDPSAIDPGASVWSTFTDLTTDGLGANPAKRMGPPVVSVAPQSSVTAGDSAHDKDLLIAAQQKQIEALERHIRRLEAALDRIQPESE